MLNLIQADIYRVLHSTTIKILLTMTTVFSVILFGGMYLVANGTINQDLTNIIFLASDMNMVTLIGAILAIHLVSAEFESRNMHHLITSGFSRMHIVISKMVAYCLLFTLVISPYFIGGAVTILLNLDVNANTQLAGIMLMLQEHPAVSTIHALLLLAVIALVYIAQLSTTVLFAFMFKKASLVIPLFYVISITSGQISLYKEHLGTLADMLRITPFASDFILIGVATTNDTLLAATVTSFLYIIAITALACLYFRKRDIQ